MDCKYLDIVPDNREVEIKDPAITFSFKLDNFQKQSQYYIQQGENVLVTAHTSAGKTVVAEAGIGYALKMKKRVFYTSPIKTLSNQKYNSFCQKFGTNMVGLLTGDIKCNPDAPIVIMTTEILRDMLYRQNGNDSEGKSHVPYVPLTSLDNLGCVIFDEVHYINNKQRGHVWEQCFMKLKNDVTLVLLSASIAEPEKFASWIGNLMKRPIHLITTKKRPVPLNHFVYMDDNLLPIMDEQGIFNGNNYQNYYHEYTQLAKKQIFNPLNMLNPFITHLKINKLTPALFFVFSRKNCELYASKVSVSLTTGEEQAKINHAINSYLVKHPVNKETLEKIPQVGRMKSLMIKGIGVHHSGLLQVLKEIVELLFSQGLIKVLFATETFAVGVNTPTKSVIFTELTKYCDNNPEPRILQADEYIQMSGRAGRRGLDKFGSVIHLPFGELQSLSAVRGMLLGKCGKIESKFKINYAFVLQNLLNNRKDTQNVTEQSYLFQQNGEVTEVLNRKLDVLKKKIADYENVMKKCPTEQLNKIKQIVELEKKLNNSSELGNVVIKMNKNQEKKMRNDLHKLTEETSKIADYKQIKENMTQNIEITKEIQTIENQISYYNTTLTKQYMDCLSDLYDMGYINEYPEEDKIFKTGRELLSDRGIIASHIVSANEILLTELMIEQKLDDLDVPSLSAVLSLFCDDSRTNSEADDQNSVLSQKACDVIDWVYQISEECCQYPLYEIDLQDRGLNDSFASVAYMWAQGKNYFEIANHLETFEGNFTRNMLRLAHLCDEIAKVCEICQYTVLEKKVKELRIMLIRDIVTFDSLYLKV